MSTIAKYVKPAVLQVEREILRDELAERPAYLRLDKNENLHAFDDPAFEAFKATFTQEMVWGYPDLRALYERLAAHSGVGADQLLLANGSDAAIKALFDACVAPGDQVILHAPSYFMFDVYARLAGAQVSAVPVCDWLPNVEQMLAVAGPRAKLMVMEDPSGFVGTAISVHEMRALAHHLRERGILLLIDEAYLYVGADRSEHLGLLRDYDNVVLSRTLSKAHGLAGARVGFLISNAALMAQIAKCRPLYEISALSAHVACWVLEHPEVVEDFRQTVAESKARLFETFARLGLRYRDTRGNFVLLHCQGFSADEMVARLAAEGILVRRPFADAQITDWLRVSVAGPWATRKFLEALEKSLPAALAPTAA